jgi:acyl dehydratase
MQQVLHAEQRFSFHHPVLVGDVLEISRQITDLYDKRNGALQFIVVNTHFCRAGKRVAEGAQTILVRRPAQATAAKVAA